LTRAVVFRTMVSPEPLAPSRLLGVFPLQVFLHVHDILAVQVVKRGLIPFDLPLELEPHADRHGCLGLFNRVVQPAEARDLGFHQTFLRSQIPVRRAPSARRNICTFGEHFSFNLTIHAGLPIL
jgi:hypothetical protein